MCNAYWLPIFLFLYLFMGRYVYNVHSGIKKGDRVSMYGGDLMYDGNSRVL